MIEHEVATDDPDVEDVFEPRERSRMDQLRAAFAEQVDDDRLYKRLPRPAEPQLVAEYRVISSEDARGALRGKEELESSQDLLAKALVAIHVHDPKNPQADKRGLVDLARWAQADDLGGSLRFDKRFTDLVGLTQPHDAALTTRQITLEVFGRNEIALQAQSAELLAWMSDTRQKGLQDFTPGS